MLNNIVLQGRLCSDPELRYTPNQIPVVSFTLAVDRDYTGKGENAQQTDFLDVVAWRKTAEFVSRYFQKGSMALVSGRMTVRPYKDREGAARRAYEVEAEHVWFGESRRSAEAPAEPPRGYVSNPPDCTGAFPAASRPVDVAPPFTDLVDEYGGELPFD